MNMTNGYNNIMTPMELKQWRKKNGYTQITLAKALNVYQETVARWETGVREIPSFLHLALDALECKKKEVKKVREKKKEV
jgi:DNA-binding transcriptional regulator YiaG